MSARQVITLPSPMGSEQKDEGHAEPAHLRGLDEETKPQRVPANPKNRRIGRPQDREQDDEEEARVIEESLGEIQVHEITGAARAAAAQAGQPGQAYEDALRQLQPGQEPTPGEDRARHESRRPDELVIELARIGRSADRPDHGSVNEAFGRQAKKQPGKETATTACGQEYHAIDAHMSPAGDACARA